MFRCITFLLCLNIRNDRYTVKWRIWIIFVESNSFWVTFQMHSRPVSKLSTSTPWNGRVGPAQRAASFMLPHSINWFADSACNCRFNRILHSTSLLIDNRAAKWYTLLIHRLTSIRVWLLRFDAVLRWHCLPIWWTLWTRSDSTNAVVLSELFILMYDSWLYIVIFVMQLA